MEVFMSRELVKLSKNPFDRSHDFLVEFINKCPEKIWAQSFGGFLVWQQVYHAFAIYDFCEKGEHEAFFSSGLFGENEADVVLFKKIPSTLQKDILLEFSIKVKAEIDTYFDSLKDEDLAKKHERLSARLGREFSVLEAINLITNHNMYHLGGCDAALRGNGYKGIY